MLSGVGGWCYGGDGSFYGDFTRGRRKMLNEEDLQVVKKAQDGSREALECLFRRFYGVVFAHALSCGLQIVDAEDVCQLVFIIVRKKVYQLKDPSCFPAWLRSVVQRTAINYCLREKRYIFLETGAWKAVEYSHAPIDGKCSFEQTEMVARLHSVVDSLKDLDRQILKLFYFDRMTILGMSAKLGCPVGTIKRRLHMARKRLAVQVQRLAPELEPEGKPGRRKKVARTAVFV